MRTKQVQATSTVGNAEKKRQAERERQLTATMMTTVTVYILLLAGPRLLNSIVSQFTTDQRALQAMKANISFSKLCCYCI